jgi:hypothetical protein
MPPVKYRLYPSYCDPECKQGLTKPADACLQHSREMERKYKAKARAKKRKEKAETDIKTKKYGRDAFEALADW